MKCLFCSEFMSDNVFHVCNSTVPNMSLRPSGLERMGVVTFGAQPPNTACSGLANTSPKLASLAKPTNR